MGKSDRGGKLEMGWYVDLRIGPFEWSWRKSIVPEVGLLFLGKSKYIRKIGKDKFIGFKSSVSEIKENLDSLGLTLEFFETVYYEYRKDILSSILSFLYGSKISLTKDKDKKILNKIHNIEQMIIESNSKKDFVQAISLIKKVGHYEWNSLLGQPTPKFPLFLLEFLPALRERGRVKVEDIVLPAIVGEFIHFAYTEFPEIAFLTEVRLILEALPENTEVILDLTRFEDEIFETGEILDDLIYRLTSKIVTYQRTFGTILGKWEQLLRETYRRSLIFEWERLNEDISDQYEKGKRLEDFICKLFKSSKDFELLDRNIRAGNKEVDLLIKIKNEKFMRFGNINSPVILVECKNWNKKVGVKEGRVFESKLSENPSVYRFGVFIVIKGFTKKFKDYCREIRNSKNIWIFTLDRKNFEELFVQSDLEISNWLETTFLHQLI